MFALSWFVVLIWQNIKPYLINLLTTLCKHLHSQILLGKNTQPCCQGFNSWPQISPSLWIALKSWCIALVCSCLQMTMSYCFLFLNLEHHLSFLTQLKTLLLIFLKENRSYSQESLHKCSPPHLSSTCLSAHLFHLFLTIVCEFTVFLPKINPSSCPLDIISFHLL